MMNPNSNYRSETQKFANVDKFDIETTDANSVLIQVHNALKEKGYNPVNQIVGYILSGDPTYITGHNNARSLIGKLERDELLEEIVMFYLNSSPSRPQMPPSSGGTEKSAR